MKPYPKYFEKIRIRRDPAAETVTSSPRCQWDGCEAAGTHRAPVGRMREGEYFRFCFDHVREYNKGFNYFSGLADSEVARFQKEALTGHRPTWKMGTNSAAPDQAQKRSGRAGYYNRIRDPFNVFSADRGPDYARKGKVRTLEARALETLGLGVDATGEEIKARYKELVKRHHPDANGGDRASEERLSAVLQAYRQLKQAGLC